MSLAQARRAIQRSIGNYRICSAAFLVGIPTSTPVASEEVTPR
jgi:hypothetical protein